MIALRALATLVVALMFAVLLGLLVLGTPGGSAWLVATAAGFAGNHLSLTGIRGTLLEGLAVERLQISAGRTNVVIEPAELSMNWPDLLRRRVRLTTLRADVVRIDIAPRPPDEPESKVQPLILPLAVSADALEIRRLLIRNGVNREGLSTEALVPVEIGPVTLRGQLKDGVLQFSSLQAELYGFTVEASGLFGTGEPFALDAKAQWRHATPAVRGAGTLKGDLATLRFEQVLRLPSPVGVGGVARLLREPREIVAEARWEDLQSQPFGADPALIIRSDAGSLRLRGWPDRYVAVLDAGARLGDWPKARVRATAGGDTRQLELRNILLDGFGGQVTGTGRITLRDAISGNFALQGRRLDPGFLDRRLAGRVDFRGAVDFDSLGNFRVQLPEAGGTVFDRPLRASGTVARAQNVMSIDDVKINAGVNRVELSGQLGRGGADRMAGQFRINAPDLATLWPGLKGQLRGNGSVGGTTNQPSLDLDLVGSNLEAGDLRAGGLKARGGVRAGGRLAINADATALTFNGVALGNFSLGIVGRREAHTAELALSGGDVEARLAATGTYRNGILDETIDTGVVTVMGDQRWTLGTPATARVASGTVGVTAHCWRSGDAELCLADARSDARGFSGGLDLQRFPLASLAPWLPADIGLAGLATAALSFRGAGEALTANLQSSLQDAVITWRVPNDDDVESTLTEFSVGVDLNSEALDFKAVVAESFGLRLTTNGRVTKPFGAQPTILADFAGGVPDIAALSPLLERLVDVGDLKGRINVAATLTGKARQPDISGGVQLEDGAFTVPAAGVTVDRISLALKGRADGQLALAGNARSGKGFVALDGTLAWRDQLLPTATATVKGRVFDVINLPQGLVQVSPDVQVILRDRQFRVSGDMLVPRAEIKLKKIQDSAVQVSPDTVVHGRDVVLAEKRPPLFVLDDLQVRLGEKATFEGFGLKTGLTGGLRLNQSLGADPRLVTGDGVVSLRDGQFSAFGQKLAINRGSLLFSGVVTDPGLDVKASRKLNYAGRDVTVDVLLSGTLSRIQTRVFSEPAMGELDALSYLTTGKPLSAAGAGDRSAVSSAAISLGLNQALPVVQQLGSALRVDEIGIDSSQTGSTAVVIGEQVGNNLFIRYSYGIFDKLGTVKATYKLGRRLSIEGTSGTAQQGLDLVYSITW